MILLTCANFDFILKIVGYLFGFIQWIIPMVLIALIIFDLFKAFTNGDEKGSKDATSRALKRFVYAIIIFLIPVLVRIIFKAVDKASPKGYGTDNSATTWISCFNAYFK